MHTNELIRQISHQQEQINQLLCKLLWGQFQSMGWADLLSNKGLRDLYHRWMKESIAFLTRHQYIKADGTTYVANASVDLDEAWREWDQKKTAWLSDGATRAQVILVEATLRVLPDILTGKTLATDIMFPNSSMALVEGIYKHNPVADYFNEALGNSVITYIQQRLQKDPAARIRIIEIGAGTGGTSAGLFKKLKPFQNHIQEYCYTDLSKAFLLHAEATYGPDNPYLTYQIFDVSAPLSNQNVEPGSYDIVIAANVLHATKNIRQTLRNAKAVLKGKGLILLNEITANSLFNHLTFGLLEGWWLYEDTALRIPGCPGLSPANWKKVLEIEGFKSVSFPAQVASEWGQQIIIAESDGVVMRNNRFEGFAQKKPGSLPQAQKTQAVQSAQPVQGAASHSAAVSHTTKIEQQATARQPMSRPTTQKSNAPSTKPARSRSFDLPDQMIEDFVRTSIRENIGAALKMDESRIQNDQSFSEYGVDSIVAVNLINLINQSFQLTLQTTVLFDYNNVDQLTKHIFQTHKNDLVTLLRKDQPEIAEEETFEEAFEEPTAEIPTAPVVEETNSVQTNYVQTNYVQTFAPLPKAETSAPILQADHFPIQVTPAATPASMSTKEPVQSHQTTETVQVPPQKDSHYYRVIIERPGVIDDLRLIQSAAPALQDDEVRIAVRAFALNFGDLLSVKGLYPTMPPYPFTPGFEASGVVIETGRAVTTVQKGDAVVFCAGESMGAQATLITCAEKYVYPVSKELSFEEACSLPTVAVTMIDAFHRAQLKKGERILIQTATGGTGLIAVQMAQAIGAEIYATAGSQHKLDYLRELGVPHTINYLEHDFEAEIKRLTNGKGVDVVINTLAGDAIQKGMNCLAPGGRYIEIAMTALKSAKTIDLSVLNNNQTFYSVDLRKLGFANLHKLREYQQEMTQLVDQGVIRPTISQIFTLDQVKEAYQCLEDRGNIGKVVVSIPEAYQYQATATNQVSQEANLAQPSYASTPFGQKEPIAIIGMSGRFAKSKNVQELWEHLAQGDDLIEEASRWDLSQYEPEGKTYCKHGSFIDDIDQFDPLFFNISGTEATYMDPQQRIFLEESWKSLENAGYAGEAVQGSRCGVYVGCSAPDYQHLLGDTPPAQSFWGNANSVIPARIAYYLDLQGPAIAVDTACSSSLVAVHLACQGLWSNETQMALAGGIFVQSTPNFYLASNRAGMLSPTGRCYTFDDRADGFVPGEGVGVVVLKRLSDAIADGDHIHGVIRGTAVNQDGTTNGITAPSAKSQERLELEVYDSFGIHPEQIQMIEAHGTGTKLGDPIEFQALTKAFRHYTDQNEFCAIGSIKTNIGHSATAAGVAGIIKILLSLQHQKIPASLHYQNGNPNISFDGSPFYVNTTTKDWVVNPGTKRAAAVSSFGFSGTNSHIVIEEAPHVQRKHTVKPAYLITLSARTPEQLREQALQLVEFCETGEQIDCGNMSYTLLVGRKHLNCRLATVIRSQNELVAYLRKWLDKGNATQVYVAELNKNEQREQAALKRYGNECIQHAGTTQDAGEYYEYLTTVADLYVQGYGLEYQQLFSKGQYSRMPLPTYPFARERYWVPKVEAQPAVGADSTRTRGNNDTDKESAKTAVLHPLLHQNTSDFVEQRYRSTFTGQEFFLADHVVNGHNILPGVAYLEMVRAAVTESVRGAAPVNMVLQNIVWASPVRVGDAPVHVHTSLDLHENGEIHYIVYSEPESESHAKPLVHSRGLAIMVQHGEDSLHPQTLDLSALQAQCSRGTIDAEKCYEAFQKMGLAYGPSHQGIEKLYLGQQEVLAKLSLPSCIAATEEQYVLHPSLMDSALQAAVGLMLDVDGEMVAGKPGVPFALQEVEILRPCTSDMWAWVRYSQESTAQDQAAMLDIDICDAQGNLCVCLRGFTTRGFGGETSHTDSQDGMLLMEADWKEQAIDRAAVTPAYAQQIVMTAGCDEMLCRTLTSQLPDAKFIRLHTDSSVHSNQASFGESTVRAFEEIQNIILQKPKETVLIQVVIPNHGEQQLFSALTGLLRTAQLENPKLIGQLIEVEAGEEAESIARHLIENSRQPMDTHIRYHAGRRFVSGWSEVQSPSQEDRLPWKDQGVYLITGGAGGLGLIFAKEIADTCQNPLVILTGRTALDHDKKRKLKDLQALGARVDYQQVDVTDKQAVERLIQSITAQHGQLNGIIHSAGIIHDNFILKKTTDEWQNVLAPKVSGLLHLDEATKDIQLDFFVLFSSVAGEWGNPGQADYAVANAFLDAYATYRNGLVQSGQRHGHTMSINWPLWKEGGMTLSAENEKRMKQTMGMVAISTDNGIRAFYQGVAAGKHRIMVVQGNVERMKQVLLTTNVTSSAGSAEKKQTAPAENKQHVSAETKQPASAETKQPVSLAQPTTTHPATPEALLEKATQYLIKLLSTVIGLPAGKIEANAPMEAYGIDSIMVMELTEQLEKTFGSLSKTLFFEYQTIRELTAYFVEAHREKLTELLGMGEKTEETVERVDELSVSGMSPVTEQVQPMERIQPAPAYSRLRKHSRPALIQPVTASNESSTLVRGQADTYKAANQAQDQSHTSDIAIIGLSGRYPGAANVHEFWKNLRAGKDCITEIPQDRWDPSLHTELSQNTTGKNSGKWGGFLDGVDQFDPRFFNISPREAEIMDPQERLFLQSVYEAIEDAGYTREALASYQGQGMDGNVGVYVGVMYEEYQLYGAQAQALGQPVAVSGSLSSIANRVSYYFNLHGPSVALDTMCSSSLTALHFACHSLQKGECQLAIAGGVNVSIHPNKYLMLTQGSFLSSKGRCESFGQGGDGYVPGEGVGAVLLKPLEKAIADGDHIYGIIKGTAINHGGKTNGYTVPNPNAQAAVIRQAYKEAGIDPRTVSYLEAHGTGTSLGDPIEIAGLARTFKEFTQDRQFCAIGSAKSNIGHCESAAGIAGLTKILLQLKYQQLVPSLHSQELNPNIDFASTPFVVQQELSEWSRPVIELDGNKQEYPRRAGLSSFGAGGSNAHVVIEEYIPIGQDQASTQTTPASPAVIVLSAKHADRLKEQAQRLLTALDEHSFTDADLADIAYTLQIGREPMDERLGIVAGSIKELTDKLTAFVEGRTGIDGLYLGQIKPHKEMIAALTIDEEMQETIEKWMQRQKYSKLLELWVKGLQLDWNKLYGDVQPRRISLPTYPFAKERYWIPMAEGAPAKAVPSEEAYEIMTFEEIWQEQGLDAKTSSHTGLNTVVCFLSDGVNQQTMAETLQQRQPATKLIFIAQGTNLSQASRENVHEPEQYTVSRTNPDDYREAFARIKKDHGDVDAILYLWPLEDVTSIQDYSAIVHVLQAMSTEKVKPSRLILAGQYEDELDRCYLESWIGFERSLGLLLPHTKVNVICQQAKASSQESSMTDWTNVLWTELQADNAQSVLYQDGTRYVSRIQPTTLTPTHQSPATTGTPTHPSASATGTPSLRAGGTYLITGGLGGLGLVFATHFATAQRVNLILLGRSPLDEARRKSILALEALGSQIMYVQADICDAVAIKEGLQQAKARFGQIDGVIHAAGLESDRTVLDKAYPEFQKVLDPKIAGTLILDQALAEVLPGAPLDFVCYFSSSSAIIGDFGSCDYAVANRFQMAYAHYRNQCQQQHTGQTFVINWPLWKEGGMGVSEQETAQMYLKSSGQRFLEKAEGIAIFEQILAQSATQHLVLTGQRSRVNRFLGLDRGLESERKIPSTQAQETVQVHAQSPREHQKPAPASAPHVLNVSPTHSSKGRRPEMKGLSIEQCLEWDLKELTGQILKISRDELDLDENLADFGFDSVTLTEFAALLTKHYQIEITPALFFSHSTLEKLAAYLNGEHQAAIHEFYREEQAGPIRVLKEPVATNEMIEMIEMNVAPQATTPQPADDPIAIIGMSGRFPEARNVDEMWSILAEGREVVREVPQERFFGQLSERPEWKCGLVPGVSEFDPLFFEISPLEAESIDPRQRLLLQEAWNALEDAGYGARQIQQHKIGMYVGVENNEYLQLVGNNGPITSNHNAILAARLAYFLNLSGPNMAINTACSSGLVAVHQACMSLRNRECDTAVAAGVNLMLTPQPFAAMSQAGMLSPDGRCYSFDQRANGMVPGEAVAVVVLKRLSQAIADGDPIHAVIQASGINYDGKTNGITAPSGISQTNLIKEVYQQYHVNPEEIDYIVTHGTGTRLGDPVEVNALNDAFRGFTQKQAYCAITSTKTNFGHTLAASGVVSLLSLVQAMRHETIPANLHLEQENEYIQWTASPFYVNKANKPWPESGGKSRTGAVSAFGMSGTNVHLVVQSYQANQAAATAQPAPSYLLALSAKTAEALQEKAKDMLAALKKQDRSLAEVSYTLLEGRQHFKHRLALVVKDHEDAIHQLQQITQAEAGTTDQSRTLFQGTVPRKFKVEERSQQLAQQLLQRSRNLLADPTTYEETLAALADLYCQGYNLQWDLLFGDDTPRRISLPTYPFVRNHYWVSTAEKTSSTGGTSTAGGGITTATVEKTAVLHPLLHENTSTLSLQRFRSTFSGREFFLADHIVKGQKILPGVAYLEMAREAVKHSVGEEHRADTTMLLRNIVWARPLQAEEKPVAVQIGLYPEDNGQIRYEIISADQAGTNEPATMYSQGSVVLRPAEKAPSIDLTALQAQDSQQTLTTGECYEIFNQMGLEYGPALRGIELLHVGQGRILAKLSLPSVIADTTDQYALHPTMMDAALQSAIGLVVGANAALAGGEMPLKPYVPFALEELEIFGDCRSTMWALVRNQEGSIVGGKVQKLDVDLCDEQGMIRVRMRGFTSRLMDGDMEPTPKRGNKALEASQPEQAKAADPHINRIDRIPVPGQIQEHLIQTVAHLLKVDPRDVDVDIEMVEYGADQVMLSELAQSIHKSYGTQLPVTLFVEYPTIRSVVGYLAGDDQAVAETIETIENIENIETIDNHFDQPTSPLHPASESIGADLLREKTIQFLIKQLSSVLKVPENLIEADAPMEQYGIDSIMVTQLTNELEKTFGSLSKTLFFEYQNIADLSDYFVEEYREQLIELLGLTQEIKPVQPIATEQPAPVKKPVPSVSISSKPARFTATESVSLANQATVAPRSSDIAIIGISGRYPGAATVHEFWKNLRNGKDCITEIPKDRWDHSQYYDERKGKLGKTYGKWGGFIDGVDQFDPLFFNITPREAEIMDPQERLFLQAVYETLEDAGYTREAFGPYRGTGMEGNVGVYVGVINEEYQLYGAQAQVMGTPFALSGTPSSIANRVSYFCNFHGPSMAIDTMCSSSLTAIHLACQSLIHNECEMAIAGGVNVTVHPNKYLMLAQGRYMSSKGRCESFGKDGDGYVPSEGVGAVLLKPLAQAIADGDQIYGVIKGTAINHGGKTNGYSVPNPNAQGSAIGRAIKEAGIHPRTISYLEAHGTGTSLGDPIEIAGLTKTFREYTQDRQFCAIGSAKSNIGHCESAAGIASLTKVLLQMKYRQLVPSLHSSVLNPNIDFAQTPFVVQQDLAEWRRPVIEVDGKVEECPRRAGISSFGAGGSNAHIVIEEYIPNDQHEQAHHVMISPENPAVILLSARNEERLREQAQRLLSAIAEQPLTQYDLADIAYTLQIGREAMDSRLALVVSSIDELTAKLNGYLSNQSGIEDLYHGQLKEHKETLAIFTADEELQLAVSTWLQRRKYSKLLDLWVKGLNVDWGKLYTDTDVLPRRISLPTYPFAKERYWVPQLDRAMAPISTAATTTTTGTTPYLHPLLHANTSDFTGQRYRSTFSGDEFFLRDHLVQGQKVLPGVTYLEMARAAVEQAGRAGKTGITLTDIVWATPISVGAEPVDVHIGLFPAEKGEIRYEIYRSQEADKSEPIICSKGRAILTPNLAATSLDLTALQSQCSHGVLTAKTCYEAFEAMGLAYGPSHRGIEKLYLGQGQVLAKLSLPKDVAAGKEAYVLHPSLMDSALQAAVGLHAGTDLMTSNDRGVNQTAVPFALQELQILRSCTSDMWALIRYSEGSSAGDKVQKLTIDVADQQGNICIRMRGFTSRMLESANRPRQPEAPQPSSEPMMLIEPVWKAQAADTQQTSYTKHIVMLAQPYGGHADTITQQMNGVTCTRLQSDEPSMEQRFRTYAAQAFETVKAIILEKPKGMVLIQIVILHHDETLLSALGGLLKTARLENPKLITQLIEVGTDEDTAGIIEKLRENSRSPMDTHIRYQAGRRLVAGWSEQKGTPSNPTLPWKDNGIYLITGGAGGLGLLFAKEIAQRVKNATLILTGRSPLQPDIQAKLTELQALGAHAAYQSVDVTNQQSVEDLVTAIKQGYGGLTGILHSAGVILDNYLMKKSREEWERVVAPKASGVVHLDEATKELPLDFFVLFSSISGGWGNPGQSDYATANAFLDAFAHYRNRLRGSGQRHGHTISINWPLWREGGMRVDPEIEKMMMKTMGMKPLQTSLGILALYQAMASNKSQVLVIEGDLARVRATIDLTPIDMTVSDMITSERYEAVPFTPHAEQAPTDEEQRYASIIEKIAKGELSKEQLLEMMSLSHQ
ncbi:SDR family NAD(P)-dependent oxidoreductase [Brevibacillus dissolubilis]|uniref:SDR family NAD(P)-dependent oxidoreductase n=1 Tax=Brevibacillus dissolubilis TaxID=1844116 RepID=UPI0021003956|nr:SDR family NAD(P)-dependent oxidoreductase [Brevibacillus dissolubilis]